MRISTLGSGKVARTLGEAWAARGHEVYIGARQPHAKSIVAWRQGLGSNTKVQVGSLQEAAAFGEIVLLAINPWTEIEEAVKSLTQELKVKIIIDVSNNIDFDAPPKMAFTDQSMGEAIQSWLPEAHVVKTLNIIPAPMMVNPAQSGIVPAVGWVSGNNNSAKQKVIALVKTLGWSEVVDLGNIYQSRLQESIGLMLSIIVSSTAQKDSPSEASK